MCRDQFDRLHFPALLEEMSKPNPYAIPEPYPEKAPDIIC